MWRLVTKRKRNRVDPIELVVLAVFAATSVWVLVLGLWWTVTEGRVWTGVKGVYVQDVTQYLAWVRDASRHVLVSDLFVLRDSPHDYLQPAIAISGGLVAIGMAPWLALALWQPVAVGGTFLAIRALVHGQLDERLGRRAALVLALFGASVGTFQDLWLPWWTWGYVFGVLSLAAMVASLLLYERPVRGAAPVWPAAVLAGLSSWLHPWQGAVLALIIAGAEVVLSTQPSWSPGAPRRRSLSRPGLVLVAISLPLAYYAMLDRADPAWRLAGESLVGAVPAWQVLVMLAPLLTPALLAYGLRPLSFTAAALRVWPPAAFAVYLAGDHGLGNEPMHAFLGISIPLAILAAQGVGSLRWRSTTPRRALAMLAVSALTVPQAVSELTDKWRFVRPSTSPITVSDWQAISYLGRDPRPAVCSPAFPSAATSRRRPVGAPTSETCSGQNHTRSSARPRLHGYSPAGYRRCRRRDWSPAPKPAFCSPTAPRARTSGESSDRSSPPPTASGAPPCTGSCPVHAGSESHEGSVGQFLTRNAGEQDKCRRCLPAAPIGTPSHRRYRLAGSLQMEKRFAQHTRHVHLRVADLSADLALREPVPETQPEHLALHLAERAPVGDERLTFVGDVESILLAAERVRERTTVLFVRVDGGVERDRVVVVGSAHRLNGLLGGASERLGELVNGRSPTEFRGEALAVPADRQGPLLKIAWNMHAPALVAEMPLQLTDDRRRRVRRELLPAARLEPVDCVQ